MCLPGRNILRTLSSVHGVGRVNTPQDVTPENGRVAVARTRHYEIAICFQMHGGGGGNTVVPGDSGRRGRHETRRILRVPDAAEQVHGREQDGRLSRGVQRRSPRRVLGRRVSRSTNQKTAKNGV